MTVAPPYRSTKQNMKSLIPVEQNRSDSGFTVFVRRNMSRSVNAINLRKRTAALKPLHERLSGKSRGSRVSKNSTLVLLTTGTWVSFWSY